ncbi:MAG: EAL domain-containing protein [Clostridia bacterium]|nr:EAL domain-containing protein [Clostridia bacterium]
MMSDLYNGEQARNGKRRILVVEDEPINQALLGQILEEQYDVSFAATGGEALHMIEEQRMGFSLMLLDLLLPDMNGMDILRNLREDGAMSSFPIIVMTSDKEAEVQCLTLGATDFISKPYPMPEVIRARVFRTIELFEGKHIIQLTERDQLTGLYNRDYFYRYAEQLDQFQPDQAMDAIVIDVNHFHMIIERYGKSYGDEVLKRIGESVNGTARKTRGIACRYEADTFMLYCTHQEDYEKLLESASQGLFGNKNENNRVRLRMGVYSNADKSIDVTRRFDRAKTASDTIRNSFTNTIAKYDVAFHEAEVFSEQLLEDFHDAIASRQFEVYYQPKFDIRGETPRLSSAEALVRWRHPTFGMISPGIFIALFEKNGLIPELDRYVWREAAAQIRDWKKRLGLAVPVSVNVSRIDMYDPHLVETMQGLIHEFGINTEEFLLEITESAYTQESDQIIETVNQLRALGFRIEMDDFGVGYSTLNMISTLPIDALKLDMMFIRSAFEEKKDTRIIEVIIEIADYLSVPVIAEGVETENQVKVLRQMGCDIVQGYFFSKPVPAERFEDFLVALRDEKEGGVPERSPEEDAGANVPDVASTAGPALRGGDLENQATSEKKRRAIPLRGASFVFVTIAFIFAIALFAANASVTRGYQQMEQASSRYIQAQQAANALEVTSDYMTDKARCFVATGEIEYLNDFFQEVEVTKRRDAAVAELENLLNGSDSAAYAHLSAALDLSNELIAYEHQAMKLRLSAGSYPEDQIPDALKALELSPEEDALPVPEKITTAIDLVYGKAYMDYKTRIKGNIALCTEDLIAESDGALRQSARRMTSLLRLQTTLTVLMLLVVLVMVVFISLWVRKPLTRMVSLMKDKKTVPPDGAEELQFVSQTYNEIFEENEKANDRLTYEAMHDTLTGLYNQNGYDILRRSVDLAHVALLILDINGIKGVSEAYGRDIADQVIREAAEIMQRSFRSVDLKFRIGSDEFVIIMARVNSSMRELVEAKVEQMNIMLQHPKNGLPPVSLSVGVAFSDRQNPKGDLFRDADSALNRLKESSRIGCMIY